MHQTSESRKAGTPEGGAESFVVTAPDGFRLAGLRWLPTSAPRAVLLIVHGMAEHKERYAPFAEACAAAGVAVYAHDHRGHGASIDDRTPLGYFADYEGWRKVVGDLHAVARHARAAHPGLPVFLFGHSMGSYITRTYLLDHGASLAGAIISATGFRMGLGNRAFQAVAVVEMIRRGARTASQLMTKLVFGTFNLQFVPTRTPFDWLSRDKKVVDAYIADPLCGFDCTAGFWTDFFGGIYALERAEGELGRLPRTPLLLVAGTRDPVSVGGLGNGMVAKRYRDAGVRDVTDKRYRGGRHELLNETNREEVVADILAWLERHI